MIPFYLLFRGARESSDKLCRLNELEERTLEITFIELDDDRVFTAICHHSGMT